MFKTLTEQNRNDENYKQTGITFKNFYKSRCQNNCDPSSSWRSPVIAVKQASEITLSWTIKSLFWYPFRCVEWKATWVTTAEFTDAFTLSNLYVPVNSVVVHSKHISWKTCLFSLAIMRPGFTANFTFRFCILIKKLRAKVLNSTCRTISVNTIISFKQNWFL